MALARLGPVGLLTLQVAPSSHVGLHPAKPQAVSGRRPSPRSPGPTHTPGRTVLCSDPWLQASSRHCGGRRGAGGARHSAPTPRSLPLAGKRPQAQLRTRRPGPGRSPGAGTSGWLTLGGACEGSISSPQPPSFCPQTRVASQRPTPPQCPESLRGAGPRPGQASHTLDQEGGSARQRPSLQEKQEGSGASGLTTAASLKNGFA